MTRNITFTYCILSIFFVVAWTNSAHAEDLGMFEGAVWRFKLTPKNQQLTTMAGLFRVHNGVLYQKSSPGPDAEEKVVGSETLIKRRNKEGSRLTRLNFTDLHARSEKKDFKGNRVPQPGIKGTVLMHQDRFGKWTGAFIAEDGRHWNFSCQRVRE